MNIVSGLFGASQILIGIIALVLGRRRETDGDLPAVSSAQLLAGIVLCMGLAQSVRNMWPGAWWTMPVALVSESLATVGAVYLLVQVFQLEGRLALSLGERRRLARNLEGAVTEASADLASQDATFKSLTRLAPVGVFRCDAFGRCVYVNRRWNQLTGLSLTIDPSALDSDPPPKAPAANEIVVPWLSAVAAADRAHIEHTWRQSLINRQTFEEPFRLVLPAGDTRWVVGRGQPEPHPAERPSARFLLILNDITSQKHVEEELRRKNQLLQATNNELRQYASAVSHDLREPLRKIRSYLLLMEQRCGEQFDASATHYLTEVVTAAERMEQMIRDILDYAMVDRGLPEPEPVDLEEVAADTIRLLDSEIAKAEADVMVGDLPVVWGQQAALARLLQNLLGNALKYRSTIPPVIHISAAQDPNRTHWWILQVADNGIGIPEHEHGRIFQMFQRLHTRDEYPGNGLGLAICQKIAERHGGRIWVESTPGAGSTFFVSLPDAEVGLDPVPATDLFTAANSRLVSKESL